METPCNPSHPLREDGEQDEQEGKEAQEQPVHSPPVPGRGRLGVEIPHLLESLQGTIRRFISHYSIFGSLSLDAQNMGPAACKAFKCVLKAMSAHHVQQLAAGVQAAGWAGMRWHVPSLPLSRM